jgi:hypothetical protein
VCLSARMLIEHGDWAGKEEVSKEKQRENVPADYQRVSRCTVQRQQGCAT